MLTLNDGRKELYQWDTGRTATVDIECDVVHFANLKYGESLAVEVKVGKVAIPNKLLMSGEPIYCWAFVKDAGGAYTKKEQTLDVVKRAKPSDYVYTETDVITVKTAVENALQEAKERGDFKGDTGEKGDKGDKGDTGDTPYIGANGNWYIGSMDTGKPSRGAAGEKGEPGETGPTGPQGQKGDKGDTGAAGTDGITPTIGANGNWYLGNTDTGKPSRGATGATGATGAAGAKGEKGPKGDTGPAGKSAYASAQDGGFTGTEAQFNKGLSVMGDVSGIDTTVTQNSGNLITSGAVYSYIQSLDANEVKY